MPRAEEFLYDEIPEDYRSSLPGSATDHKEYDDQIIAARQLAAQNSVSYCRTHKKRYAAGDRCPICYPSGIK